MSEGCPRSTAGGCDLLASCWGARSNAPTDPELLVRIEISEAYVAMEVGDPAEAARLCESALGNQAIRPGDRGVALGQLGMVQMRRGEAVAALAAFTEGIELLAGSPTDLARALGNRGDVYLHQGQAGPAARDLERAAALFAEQGAEIELAKARHNLGYALFLDGDLVGALAAMESAAPLPGDRQSGHQGDRSSRTGRRCC